MRGFIILFSLLFHLSAYAQTLSDDLSWYFLFGENRDTVFVGKNGSVQYSLWKQGVLPNPFVDSNDLKYGFLENEVITLKANFEGDEYLNFVHVELGLDRVDTYAQVLINGDPVLFTENAFRTYTVDVSNALVSGQNEIELVFTPPVLYHQKEYEQEAYHLPAPNDEHPISIASRVRKAQFQFGWDWAPRMNTVGINGSVRLRGYNGLTVKDPSVHTYLINDSVGVVRYKVAVHGDVPKRLTVRSNKKERSVSVINGLLTWQDTVTHPEFWYPIGHGRQFKYTSKIDVLDSVDQLVESFNIKYGFKNVELVQQLDRWGESYYFKINGKRIFAKGANYIPADLFLHNITPEKEREYVSEMARSNFNMIRVWGGGTYASDDFLSACDSMGILVWHDLMFACAMYPSDTAFLDNVSKEMEQQFARILSHPCIAQINGNNEVDVAWKNWGLQESYGLDENAQDEISEGYAVLFKELIPSLLDEYLGIPYTHSSPLSNWGKLEDFNSGSQHYWGLWHGNDVLSDALIKVGRFNSEYGFQSFPSLKLLQDYSSKSLNDLNDPFLKYRQRSYVGNKKIFEKIEPLYGAVKDLEDFTYKSQLYQAKALETYIIAHRMNPLRCGGTLFWQLNDVYPGPTWSTVDFNGTFKAAHYAVRENFEDLLVHWMNDSLVISNLTGKEVEITVHFQWKDLKGKVKEEGEVNVSLKHMTTKVLEMMPVKRKNSKKDLVLELSYSERVPELTVLSFVRKDEYALIPGEAQIESVEFLSDAKGVLNITVSEFSEKLWIQCDEISVQFDSNFRDYLPGTYQVSFTYNVQPSLSDFHIYGN